MVTRDLREAFARFSDPAYATPPGKAACRLAMARADLWRMEQEDAGLLRVRWECDPYPYELGDAETEYPREVLGCIIETRPAECGDGNWCEVCGGAVCLDGWNMCKCWEHRASLWSIADPDEAYMRHIVAELCMELMP